MSNGDSKGKKQSRKKSSKVASKSITANPQQNQQEEHPQLQPTIEIDQLILFVHHVRHSFRLPNSIFIAQQIWEMVYSQYYSIAYSHRKSIRYYYKKSVLSITQWRINHRIPNWKQQPCIRRRNSVNWTQRRRFTIDGMLGLIF